MCYQTRLIKKKEEIIARFRIAQIGSLKNIEPLEYCIAFDYPKTPVVIDKNPDKIELYNWGLIPEWSKDDSIKQYTLNARIETLDKKPSFKEVIQNRCLIIADGFYEWQWHNKSGSKKTKYLITLQNEELFAFAGIYSQWIDFDATITNTYSIVTTQGNELMSEIHNTKQRMPVILKKDDENKWLNGEDYKHFAYPYSCELFAKPLIEPGNQLNLF